MTADQRAPEAVQARVPRIVAIVLMYRAAEQAIECVSSLLKSVYGDFRIVLLDNASPDGAYVAALRWAKGDRPTPKVLSSPLGDGEIVSGPIDFAELGPDAPVREIVTLAPLTLVQTGANLGYAGGNNVALRWLQACQDWDYAWILNPDLVVDPNAMAVLAARCERSPGIGPVGARILSYDRPERVEQLGGGKERRLRGTGAALGLGTPADASVDTQRIEAALDYVSGCSLFFSRAFLDRANLMDEGYFLYYEDLDWCRRRGTMPLGYAHEALIYHRHGGSIGSSTSYRTMSPFSVHWAIRSRLRYARKFHPWALPFVYGAAYIELAQMIRQGAWRNAWTGFKALNGFGRLEPCPPGP